MNLTEKELKDLGLDENQIAAVIAQSKNETSEMPGNIEVKEKQPVRVTSVVDLQQYAKGTIVELPDFAEGQPFVARLRRPSMLVLAKSGKIPNSLLNTANELFANGGSGIDTNDESMLKDMYNICRIICESALVEPTLADIENAGMDLSDDQMLAIFNYTQSGIKALESFR